LADLAVPCDSVVLLRLIYGAVAKSGIIKNSDKINVRQQFKITDELLSNHHFRFPHNLQIPFWQFLETYTNDPCVGLHLSEHLPSYRGQVVEYFFYSSRTFGKALEKAARFYPIISDAIRLEFIKGEHESEIKIHTQLDEDFYLRHFVECLVKGMCVFFSNVLERNFKPTRIYFAHACYGDIEEYEKVLVCPVEFNAVQNSIVFDSALLNVTSPHAEPELAKLHEVHAVSQLQRLMRTDLIRQLADFFASHMTDQNINLGGAAQYLGLSVRQLRQELSEAGTSFNQTLAEYRCKNAKRMLADESIAIDDVVWKTGFSEPSTFYRAFKRWTGLTPLEYRKRKQRQNSAVKA
jgi:AraC-like DNA-binding protein